MPAKFQTMRRVEFADTDMVGLVHFSNFFRYMEAAEVEFLRSLGLSVAPVDVEGQRVSFPRRAAACDFLGPARFGDVLDITLRVEKIGRTSVTYSFDFTCGERRVARGTITAVCCRLTATHVEAVEIPAVIRSQLEPDSVR
jgi:YbgC/YbaW family acyl-CoA thioester hydrolase